MNNNGFSSANDAFTEKVIGLAIAVHTELGPGFLESIYHQALLSELSDAGLSFKSEAKLAVLYKGKPVGTFAADIIVEDKLLLELKAVDTLATIHEVQVVNYLKATGLNLGLLFNFGSSTLQVKRKYRERAVTPSELWLQEI